MGGRRRKRSLEQELLGAPALPPARLAAWLTAGRRRLRRLQERAAPPPVRILETLFAQVDSHVLRVLVELGVPDHLDRPMPLSELNSALGTEQRSLERLLRYAAARDFLSIDRTQRISATGITKALRSDAPAPWHGWVRFATSRWFDEAFRHLGAGIASNDRSAFDVAHGMDFFSYARAVDPEAGVIFDQAMSAGAAVQALALARTLDWTNVRSVCDVGGGSGVALDVLQRCHPHLDATLFDLPDVVARSGFLDDGHRNRQAVGGSFFDDVPAGHDRYQLLAVVHDWDDERATELLGTVRDAMGPSASTVVVETPRSEAPIHDFAAVSDLLMLTLASGRERTDDELRRLFSAAGLAVTDRHLLASGATAYELAAVR